MGSCRSFCSRRDAVVTFGRDSSAFEPRRRPVIGVRLMMSSSAPPTQSDRACVRIVASTALGDAGDILASKPIRGRYESISTIDIFTDIMLSLVDGRTL